MFVLRLFEATAGRIALIHQANLNKNLPMKLGDGGLLVWGCDWVEPGQSGGMWLLVTHSRQDAARMLARKGLAESKAMRAGPTFALWLYERTAQTIASAYSFCLHKGQTVAIGEHTNLLWAFDWIQEARPGGSWLLLTQSREEASRLLAVSNGIGDTTAPADAVTITPGADSTSPTIRVTFSPEPYAFRPVQHLRQIWNVPDRKLCGVYLWCIEYHGYYLVNYVGKTSDQRGFEGRLWDELRFWRDGCKWKPVNLDALKASLPDGLSQPMHLLPTIHLVIGASAQLLATYLLFRMWFEDELPGWTKVRRIKPFMRLTLALWLTTVALGVVIYLLWYTPAAVAAPPEATPVTTPDVAAPVVTPEPNAPAATAEPNS